MTGTDAATGRALGGIAHLRQSARDILTTPVGTRVLLRDYGSRLHRVRASAGSVAAGRIEFSLEGDFLPSGQPVRLEGVAP